MRVQNKKTIIFLSIVAIIAVFFSLTIFDRGFGFALLASQSPSYNYTYGTFHVYVFNPNNDAIKVENITGIMICIDNVCSQNLQITSISNSTYSTTPIYYVQVQIPLPNGSVVESYEKSYEIYIGYVKVLIPTRGLSPGNYVVTTNDGLSFSVKID